MKATHRVRSFLMASAVLLPALALAVPIEVLHWWTSGGEAKSIGLLKQMMEKQGFDWKDFAVAGGAGENAMTVLKTRVVSGHPPTSAQIKGPAIQEWASMGVLQPLDDVAKAEAWEKLLPTVIQKTMQYKGNYVAVPVNVHRVNWLWVNPAVFKKAGAKIPTTWDEFVTASQQIQKAGILPVAHGGQAWQDATVFEAIVLATGGKALYERAFVTLDPKVGEDPQMQKAFEAFRTYQSFTDKNSAGRDWNLATAMVIEGKAAMQIMGDWAKGEFTNAGKKPGKDFMCVPVPGTQDDYTFNIDSFVMFKQSDPKMKKAQDTLAKMILTPEFQTTFNVNKGSIPVRTDLSKNSFDACGQRSMTEFVSSSKHGTLLPSMAHNMSASSKAQGAMFDVITQYFNSNQNPKDAASAFGKALQSTRL